MDDELIELREFVLSFAGYADDSHMYHENDYGQVYCIFCSNDRDDPHEPDCMWLVAQELVKRYNIK